MYRALVIFLFILPPAYLVYLIVLYIRTRVPYVVTPKKRLPFILDHMGITPETVIYDLGCGKGDVLFAAEKFHPKKLIGFELSPLHA
ncbi:MAG: class I SAM-dependent methyltransferase, partial [Patescibacteria group bacterium]